MLKLFQQCPACGGPIIITECKCPNCQLVMRGEFQPGPFSALSEDQLTFVRVFLRARGNLSEMEKQLGISYPTIRNKLDEINLALERGEALTGRGGSASVTSPVSPNTPPPSPAAEDPRQAILRQVSNGNLSVTDALQKLRSEKGGKQ